MSERKGAPAAIVDILKATYRAGVKHELTLIAPAMAFSLVVALAPLTIALDALAPLLAGGAELLPGSPLAGGELNAEQLYSGVVSAAGPLAPFAVLAFVVWGASSVFLLVGDAIERIWRHGSEKGGAIAFLRQHLMAFLLLAGCGLALFLSSVVGNALTGLGAALERVSGGAAIEVGWVTAVLTSRVVVDFVFSALLYTVAFAVVPPVRPRVSDVVPGALLTAVAYAVGQAVLATYLSSSPRFGSLGAFGSVLAFLVWALYTSTIVLWGAELAHEIAQRRACRRGDDIHP